MIDETTEEENQQQLIFDKFLKNSRKVENITLFSRDELHER